MSEKTPNQKNIDELNNKVKNVQDEFNSSTMCLAKWFQTSINLANGHTHSCHHPSTHKVNEKELEKNPKALHNTKKKKRARRDLLNGIQTPECEYCWNIENMNKGYISDRHYKSTENWSYPHIDKIKKDNPGENINPKYLEVAFESTCNFKCSYCGPDVSSKWQEELRHYGHYSTSDKHGNLDYFQKSGKKPLSTKEDNPYKRAFWKWWPDLYQSLHTFRITGGEPLLSKDTWKVLEKIRTNPKSDLNLAINTNMQPPDYLIDKLIWYHDEISPYIKSFEIFTSAEAKGSQAEYIRWGMDYTKFMNNIEKFLEQTKNKDKSRINFMVAFNILSITTFDEFLYDIWCLRTKYNEKDSLNRIPLGVAYVRWPKFQDCRIAPNDLKQRKINDYKNLVSKYNRNNSPDRAGRFYLEEIDQVNRLCDFMMNDNLNDIDTRLSDFSKFFREYDKRRNADFLNTFPELINMY